MKAKKKTVAQQWKQAIKEAKTKNKPTKRPRKVASAGRGYSDEKTLVDFSRKYSNVVERTIAFKLGQVLGAVLIFAPIGVFCLVLGKGIIL